MITDPRLAAAVEAYRTMHQLQDETDMARAALRAKLDEMPPDSDSSPLWQAYYKETDKIRNAETARHAAPEPEPAAEGGDHSAKTD